MSNDYETPCSWPILDCHFSEKYDAAIARAEAAEKQARYNSFAGEAYIFLEAHIKDLEAQLAEVRAAGNAPAAPLPDRGKMVRPKPGAPCGGFTPQATGGHQPASDGSGGPKNPPTQPSGIPYTPGPRQAVAEYPAQPSTEAVARAAGIYIASKVTHGHHWQKLREEGRPIISTWIDESGAGQTADWRDLWTRCVTEAARASALIVYREPGEILKGAWIEVGAALSAGVPVFGVGVEQFSISKSGLITNCANIEEAMDLAQVIARAGKGAGDGNA